MCFAGGAKQKQFPKFLTRGINGSDALLDKKKKKDKVLKAAYVDRFCNTYF